MNFFENILAARGRDIDKFLPFIIVAVVIVFNIIKAIARGAKSMSQQNGIENKSVGQKKPSRYIDSPDDFKTMEQLRNEKISQIRATFGIPAPRPPVMQPEEFEEPEEELDAAPAVVAPPPVPQQPAVVRRQKRSTVSESLPEHHIDKAFSWKPAAKPASGTKKVSADICDFCFSSPNDLRKAVVYQEILGKPVSLRD